VNSYAVSQISLRLIEASNVVDDGEEEGSAVAINGRELDFDDALLTGSKAMAEVEEVSLREE
jgi:hypothetical protein